MSDLPTLWVSPVESTSGAQTGRWTREPSGPMTRPYVAKTNHVPRDELDAANKMAGELGRLMVTRDLERDAARMALVVAEGKLDAANLEIARLKGVIRRVAESMGHSGGEAPEYLPCNDSCSDCDDETIGEKHRSDLPEDRCSEHPDADGELDCWRCLLRAALTPKEPSDV